MAKITRQPLTLFGGSGPTSDFAQFGSQAASAPVKTKDIPTIQGLTAWVEGLQNAVALGQAPYLEDINGLLYVLCYELCSVLQDGAPTWDSTTVYYTGSLVHRDGTSEIYMSKGDNNSGNALPSAGTSDSHWQFVSGIISGLLAIGAPLAAPDGGISAPGIAFASEAGMGLYRASAGVLHMVVAGDVCLEASTLTTTLYSGGVSIAEAATGSWRPASDNAVSCGSSPRRWTAVWAVNGTIQTSMSHTKEDIVELGAAEIVIPKAIRFIRKGDEKRIVHLGFLADDLPQDAHPVDPETGERSSDDVETSAVIAMLCGALKNQQERIAALETRLATLEAKQ